jgi:hypothetical protein
MTHTDLSQPLHRAILRADPTLSRFDPLSRIISHDRFSTGHCGWSQLIGNYEDDLDTMLPGYAQHGSAMLSTLPHWDAGSHGGMDSSYALKIATKPRAGARNVAIKRHTFRRRGPIRLEAYFCFKPEANELKLSETDVRSIGFLFDLQGGDTDGDATRIMPHLRFLNALDGVHEQKWQYKRETGSIERIGTEDKIVSHDHLNPNDWQNLPGGDQKLCYNEIPTKVNWTYVCFDFDLATMRATGFRCNDRQFDMSAFESIGIPAMKNLWCMLNICFFAEADTDKRAFLYLDSICLSGEF